MENVITLLAGLFGGGALVQLVQTLLHRRQDRRGKDAASLGAEVAAMQQAITTLQGNLEAEVERHARERARLEERILTLEKRVAELLRENETLRINHFPAATPCEA